MKKVLILSAVILCGCVKNNQSDQFDKKMQTYGAAFLEKSQECKARLDKGEFATRKSYEECHRYEAIPYLMAIDPNSSAVKQAIRTADYKIMLAEKVDKGKMTPSEATVALNEYSAMADMQAEQEQYIEEQREYMDRQQRLQSSSALMNAGTALMQGSTPQSSINCKTRYGAYNSTTTCQ